MPVRRNVVADANAREKYVQGVIALKGQFTGVTTNMLGITGPSRPISTWDRFVAWHHAAMGFAHGGPLFLPWHRLMLRTLEQLLQQVVGDTNFGLPYWDWAADGELTPAQQRSAAVWDDACMGRSSTAPGPFTLAAFPVRLVVNAANQMTQTSRPLQRNRGTGVSGLENPRLPNRAAVRAAVNATPALVYDSAPWTRTAPGFRSRVEGWNPANGMHNIVHVWIGGDMLPSSSPNDPAFFLNHCNVDRVWEAWMQRNGRTYRPASTAGAPAGQRLNDPMQSPFGQPVTPAQVLNMTATYTYDTLAV